VALDPRHGFERYRAHLLAALGKLVKRLGDQRYRRLLQMMEAALARQEKDGVVDLHRAWIDALLAEYYDPIYAFQRESKRSRLLFAGQQTEVVSFLRQYRP
jgi:tRNA 2-selenouridine synthase